jgi:hypothetical protein
LEYHQVILIGVILAQSECVMFALVLILEAHLQSITLKLREIQKPENDADKKKNLEKLDEILEYQVEVLEIFQLINKSFQWMQYMNIFLLKMTIGFAALTLSVVSKIKI